jgi:hypothetical protein
MTFSKKTKYSARRGLTFAMVCLPKMHMLRAERVVPSETIPRSHVALKRSGASWEVMRLWGHHFQRRVNAAWWRVVALEG